METNSIDTNPEFAPSSETEPVVEIDTDTEMIDEFLEDHEITHYDSVDQDNFTRELLYQGESGLELHQQIKSDNFLNQDGTLTLDTIAKAKAHGMSDSDIEIHQNSILKQLTDQRNEMFASTGFQTGYMKVVVDWGLNNFTKAEMDIFTRETNEDPVRSLKSLEKYYQHIMSGGTR